jgi:hypothetical protein
VRSLVPYTRAKPKPVTGRTIGQGAATTAAPAQFSVLLSTGTTSILLLGRFRAHLLFGRDPRLTPLV